MFGAYSSIEGSWEESCSDYWYDIISYVTGPGPGVYFSDVSPCFGYADTTCITCVDVDNDDHCDDNGQ